MLDLHIVTKKVENVDDCRPVCLLTCTDSSALLLLVWCWNGQALISILGRAPAVIASFNASCSKQLLNVQQKASVSVLFSTTVTFGLAPPLPPWWKLAQSLNSSWKHGGESASVWARFCFHCLTGLLRTEQLSLRGWKAHTQYGQEMTALPAASTHLRSILAHPCSLVGEKSLHSSPQ